MNLQHMIVETVFAMLQTSSNVDFLVNQMVQHSRGLLCGVQLQFAENQNGECDLVIGLQRMAQMAVLVVIFWLWTWPSAPNTSVWIRQLPTSWWTSMDLVSIARRSEDPVLEALREIRWHWVPTWPRNYCCDCFRCLCFAVFGHLWTHKISETHRHNPNFGNDLLIFMLSLPTRLHEAELPWSEMP